MWGDNIPENLIDMITYELLEDPVVAEDGQTYSRATILDWFAGCRETGEPITSPLTRREIGDNLRSDPQAYRAVESFKSQYKAQHGKNQKYNESTQTIGTLAKIFEIIDPLRDLFATKNWQAPALVVMGNENSGKSSLLERLAMMPIFPKDKFICTRMAIRVHLRRGPSMAPRLDVFDKQAGVVLWSRVLPMERGREFVREAMETVMMQEFGGLTGVSKSKMLILHITGPRCPNLDMVDLPGLVSTHVRGEPENMRHLTSDLVESYVRENSAHSLFLVTVPATAAPNQSLAFEIVQKMGLHDRSIGVFTKSDKCDLRDESDGMGGLRDLRAKVYQQARDTVPLDQWGYVCVMNKPVSHADGSEDGVVAGAKDRDRDRDRESNYSALLRQSQEEVMFFREKGMMDLIQNQMAGCRALLARVSVMFHDYLRTSWAPSTILLLKEELQAVREEDRALGLPRADKFKPEGLAAASGSGKAVTAQRRPFARSSSDYQEEEEQEEFEGEFDDDEDFFSATNINMYDEDGPASVSPSREEWMGCVPRSKLLRMLSNRATALLEESSGHTLELLEHELLPNLYSAVLEESCEMAGKPSEVVAHQIAMKQRLTGAVQGALRRVGALVGSRMSTALAEDSSSLRLARFPIFVQAVADQVLKCVDPWREKTEAVMLSYVTMAFQSPLSNPSFHLKYTFHQEDPDDMIRPSVWMCFDAESLASTLAHTLVLRVSLLLTDSLSLISAESLQQMQLFNVVPGAPDPLIENCASRRSYLRACLGSVRSVVMSLMRHLSLTPSDMQMFRDNGHVQSLDLQALRDAMADTGIQGTANPPPPTSSPQQQQYGGGLGTQTLYPTHYQHQQPAYPTNIAAVTSYNTAYNQSVSAPPPPQQSYAAPVYPSKPSVTFAPTPSSQAKARPLSPQYIPVSGSSANRSQSPTRSGGLAGQYGYDNQSLNYGAGPVLAPTGKVSTQYSSPPGIAGSQPANNGSNNNNSNSSPEYQYNSGSGSTTSSTYSSRNSSIHGPPLPPVGVGPSYSSQQQQLEGQPDWIPNTNSAVDSGYAASNTRFHQNHPHQSQSSLQQGGGGNQGEGWVGGGGYASGYGTPVDAQYGQNSQTPPSSQPTVVSYGAPPQQQQSYTNYTTDFRR